VSIAESQFSEMPELAINELSILGIADRIAAHGRAFARTTER
jgi:hypothetical protein